MFGSLSLKGRFVSFCEIMGHVGGKGTLGGDSWLSTKVYKFFNLSAQEPGNSMSF